MDIEPAVTQGFLRNRFGESYLPETNRRHFEDEPSSSAFARYLTADFGAEDTLFIVVGSDSGLLQKHLREFPLGKGSRRILVESDELHALVAPCAAPNTDAASLHRFSDWEKVLQECDLGAYMHGGHVELVESLGSLHDPAGTYVPILRRMRSDLSTLKHRHSIQVSGQEFVRKQLHNACENAVPVSAVRDVGVGFTAVVLGGGPSLDDAIDWIVAHRDSLFLIAASRLCAKLRRLDIRPDAVVSVDPQTGMYDISKEGLLWRDTLLVHSYHVAPQLLHEWRGPRLYFGELNPWDKSVGKDGENFPCLGPTVSHTAAWLAHCWNFDRILLCGVDMCFAVGGSSHATGTVEGLLGSLPSQCDVSVDTYAGRRAGTGRDLEHGIECLDGLGRQINADTPRLFNTNPDAAYVASIPLLRLEDVALSGSRPTLELPSHRLPDSSHLKRVRREQGDAARRFSTIARRCKEAIRLLDEMDAAADERSFDTRRRRLDRLEKALGKEHGPWYDMIKQYASAALLGSIKPSGFGDEESGRQDWGRSYYRTVDQTAKVFIELLGVCEKRTAMRLAELEDEPDVEALLDYWASDHTPGRVLNLKDGLAPDVSHEIRSRVDEEARAYLATLENGDTVFASRVRDGRLNAVNLLRNLSFMFREKIGDDLASLANGLLTLDPPYDLFAHHAAALHAELGGDPEAALVSYQHVIDRFGEWLESDDGVPDGFHLLLEDALQHVAHCYLEAGQGEEAADALSLLSQLSPLYVPRYAHLLYLLGRHGDALTALEAHVERSPQDWRVLLQIADIYTALDSPDSAQMARRLAEETRDGFPHTAKAA